MKVLIAGANGYIGLRLLPILVEQGHDVVALVRNHLRFNIPEEIRKRVTILEGDLLYPMTIEDLPEDIEAAYYMVHARSRSYRGFSSMEMRCVQNFLSALRETNCKQVIYLGELTHPPGDDSHICASRMVEDSLHSSGIPATVIRSSLVIGAGGAHFEIMRDIVEYLPIIPIPKWGKARCQPIGIYDVLEYLAAVLGREDCYGQSFDVGGPEVFTFQELLARMAKHRGLRRSFISLPWEMERFSAWFINLVTHTSYSNAVALINELYGETEVEDSSIKKLIPHQCIDYETALERSFSRIDQNAVVSHWGTSVAAGQIMGKVQDYIHVPKAGCLKDQNVHYLEAPAEECIDRIWELGGEKGWHVWNWAWRSWGFIDKLLGGVGMRRGRAGLELQAGGNLDFWRVIIADKEHGHLLLYCEAKLPGEAWIEWQIQREEDRPVSLRQTATFRPKGLFGRFLWLVLYPVHYHLFHRLSRYIAYGDESSLF